MKRGKSGLGFNSSETAQFLKHAYGTGSYEAGPLGDLSPFGGAGGDPLDGTRPLNACKKITLGGGLHFSS